MHPPEPKRSMLLREGERSRGGQVLVLLAVALPLESEPTTTAITLGLVERSPLLAP